MINQFNCIKIDSCSNAQCPCSWYEHFMYLCDKSGIPYNRIFSNKLKDINTVDFNRYLKIKRDIVDFIETRNNIDIVVCSDINETVEYGIKLLLNYFSQISYSCFYDTYGLFIDVPRYVDRLKDNITLKDEELIMLKQNIDTVPVVVFNNLMYNDSGYINDIMYRHIYCRINNRITTIVVRYAGNGTNSNIEKLVKMLKAVHLEI